METIFKVMHNFLSGYSNNCRSIRPFFQNALFTDEAAFADHWQVNNFLMSKLQMLLIYENKVK
jgi:hypothetical protein